MRVLVVFNHPYENSYCSAILGVVKKALKTNGHECDLIHLDNDQFDPVMRAKDLKAFAIARSKKEGFAELLDPQAIAYTERLLLADHVLFIFPIWWELMPALTKGFIEKVIFPGIAYDYEGEKGIRMKNRLPRLKGVTMITTMNTPSVLYKFIYGNAIKKAVFTGTFKKIGVPNLKWVNLSFVKFRSQQKREKWLLKIEKTIKQLK